MKTSQERRRYYSARVCAQTQVHCFFSHAHSPIVRQSDTTGERLSAPVLRHGGVTPPISKLRAATEKFLMEKPNNTFCPTWESNPGPHTQQSPLRPRDQRGLSRYLVAKEVCICSKNSTYSCSKEYFKKSTYLVTHSILAKLGWKKFL